MCTPVLLLMRISPRGSILSPQFILTLASLHDFDYHLYVTNSQVYLSTDLSLSIRLYTHYSGGCVQRYLNFDESKVELTILLSKPSPPVILSLFWCCPVVQTLTLSFPSPLTSNYLPDHAHFASQIFLQILLSFYKQKDWEYERLLFPKVKQLSSVYSFIC